VEVDVTKLTIGSSVHVRDIPLPDGVEVLDDEDASVCVVAAPRAVIEETAVAEGAEVEAAAEPEVIRAKKPDEEEGSEK
jgi:large subunit ribosomal protein L25